MLINSFTVLKLLFLLLVLLLTGCFNDKQQADKITNLPNSYQQTLTVKNNNQRLTELEQYAYANVINTFELPSNSASSDCSMVLQFVATGAEGIEYIQAHIEKFKADSRLATLPICLNQPVWFENSDLSCSNNAKQRLKCNIEPLIMLAVKRSFTHVIVVGKSGKANVHNGIMYLDFEDSYSVFVHELAHFAGFVDEYPLTAELAINICKAQIYPNILVYEPNRKNSDNLIAARTCDNNANQAFKLVQEMTFMEYHDVGLIPEKYLDIWAQRLTSAKQLTPAYVNFAQYFEDQGDTINADKWWQVYQEYFL